MRGRRLPACGMVLHRALAACAATLCVAGAAQAATHYWTWNKQPSPESLEACAATLRKVAAARTLVLSLDGPAALAAQATDLGPALLSLNGQGDFRQEQFRWPGRRGFNFCKTGGFPYDAVVTAALIAARDCFAPAVLAIGSDGEWDDWAPGAKLYQSVTGRTAVSPLGGEVQEPAPGESGAGGGEKDPWVVKRGTLDRLPAGLLALFLALFFLDRFRPRRT